MIPPWPVQTFGSKSAPPIILLHGFLGSGSDWEFLVDWLAKSYFLIFPDLPGHGANLPPLPVQPLTFRWLAGGLRATMKVLELASAHLVGYSLGGRTALHFAVRFPEMVRSLVLESASPGLRGTNARRQRRLLDDERAAMILNQGMESFLDDWYSLPLFDSLRNDPDLLEDLKSRRLANHPGWMARIVSDLSPGRQPSLWTRLPILNMPVLLLAGEYDQAYTAMMKEAAELLLDAQVSISQAAGHNVHLERTGWFTEELREFYEKLEKN